MDGIQGSVIVGLVEGFWLGLWLIPLILILFFVWFLKTERKDDEKFKVVKNLVEQVSKDDKPALREALILVQQKKLEIPGQSSLN